MASVKALYSYSYQYDGAEISFVQGDEFKLLSKASKEWWHVRRWRDGVAQDIYVPANYVAEVEEPVTADDNPTYENLEELLQKQRLALEKKEKAEKPVTKPQQPQPQQQQQQQPAEKVPEDSENTYAVVGPRRAASKENSEGHGSAPQDHAKASEYDRLSSISGSVSSTSKQGVGGGGNYTQTGDGYAEPNVVTTARQISTKKDVQATAQPPPVTVKPSSIASEEKVKPAVGGNKPIADGWMPGYALPTKTRSLTTAAAKDVSEGDGTASLERFTRASTPERTASVRRPAGGPAVRPKLARPLSMHMESLPTVGGTGASEPEGTGVSTPKSSDAMSNNMSSLKMALEQKLNKLPVGGGAGDLTTGTSVSGGGGSGGGGGGVGGGGGGGKQVPPATVPKPMKVPLVISSELVNKLNKLGGPASAGGGGSGSGGSGAGGVGAGGGGAGGGGAGGVAGSGSVSAASAGGGEDTKENNKLVKTPSPDEKSAKVVPLPTLSIIPVDVWTEHRTSDGRVYYYNQQTKASSWTKPEDLPSPTEPTSATLSPLDDLPEVVAPRGWTREVDPVRLTPVYTNCKTGERWCLAKDTTGHLYYYNQNNPSMTCGELAAVSDGPSCPRRSKSDVSSDDQITTKDNGASSGDSPTGELPNPHASVANLLLTNVMNKSSFMYKKRVTDAQGKKTNKSSWQSTYVVLQDYQLIFYKDNKYKDTPGVKPTEVFPLLQATIAMWQKDKEKKKNCFQVSFPSGEQFLLQVDANNQLEEWFSSIQLAITYVNADAKDHPEKYKQVMLSVSSTDGDITEVSPKLPSKVPQHKRKESSVGVDDDADPIDDDSTDKSSKIKSRLKKLIEKRPQAETLRKEGILKDQVFGTDLAKLYEAKGQVPPFLLHFMDHIEKKGLDSTGIYRLSGNAASVTKLRYLVEQDQTIDLDDPQWADINIVTGCLKLFFRELPDPLIPFKNFKSFIETARLGGSVDNRVTGIAARVKELPTPNYQTLKVLIQHLIKVVEHGDVNKMQSSNVSIVFGPTLMRAENDSVEMAALMPLQNGIVELMISEYDRIFLK